MIKNKTYLPRDGFQSCLKTDKYLVEKHLAPLYVDAGLRRAHVQTINETVSVRQKFHFRLGCYEETIAFYYCLIPWYSRNYF